MLLALGFLFKLNQWPYSSILLASGFGILIFITIPFALYNKYSKATWFWVQEEPLNMGAASFLQMNLKDINYGVISRSASASTATGYNKVHQQEQAEIVGTAFGI